MSLEQKMQSIHDLAAARLANGPLDPNVEHDLKQIVELSTIQKPRYCKHCPFAEFLHSPETNAMNGCPGFEPMSQP